MNTRADRPRVFRVTLRRVDGGRRTRIVKCPHYERDPQDSLFGLQAKLAELQLGGHIAGQSISVPVAITPAQRQRMTRWPQALGEMLT